MHSNNLRVGTDQLTDERWAQKVRLLAAREGPFTDAYARFIRIMSALSMRGGIPVALPKARPTGARFPVVAYPQYALSGAEPIDLARTTLEIMGLRLTVRLLNRLRLKFSRGHS